MEDEIQLEHQEYDGDEYMSYESLCENQKSQTNSGERTLVLAEPVTLSQELSQMIEADIQENEEVEQRGRQNLNQKPIH